MTLTELLADRTRTNGPEILVQIVDTTGSTPRSVGDAMVVTENDTHGTIGGGTVEHLAIKAARDVLSGDADPGLRTFDLERGGNTGMVCGGTMTVSVTSLEQPARLVIAGGGHIGVALSELAVRCGYHVTVIDDRESYATADRFDDAVTVVMDGYATALDAMTLTETTAVAVATRSSTFDREALASALDGEAGYLGVVASETKAAHILDGLRDDGYSDRALQRVRAPVGLTLGGTGPEHVALSILAELTMDLHDASPERATACNLEDLVVVRGGGDLASGVCYRLHEAGVPVVITEQSQPTAVRRLVAYGSAIDAGEITVAGVTARRVASLDGAIRTLFDGSIPVIEDPDASRVGSFAPHAVVDAILPKGRFDTGTRREDAPIVIGLGPGFSAGEDVDAVVETHRGHQLGRVYYDGTTDPYDGTPGERNGVTTERVLRAPTAGEWETTAEIGELVEAGTAVGYVEETPVEAQIDGLLRGLLADGRAVDSGMKLGDVDPRGRDVDPATISDKALCVGGGVLSALLALGQ
ncbi:selenium-dependent molybdenum cofactor biosynthesis protein YqeB [Halocatena halophila]|uniref:selenium-dependent molybdenum cofactor biosynthesis protein YqeB n=1 Tax=Halocatena halophila TaxID=2814576 RepID=UPI002ED0B909